MSKFSGNNNIISQLERQFRDKHGCESTCVCVFLPLETSLISLLTAAISFLARQRTARVFSRWPKMTWLSRLLSSSKCESMVTSVELAGRGSQAEDSLAQLWEEKSGGTFD